MYLFIKTTNDGLSEIIKSDNKKEIDRIRINKILNDMENDPFVNETCNGIYDGIDPNDFIDSIKSNKDYDTIEDMLIETNNVENFINWLTSKAYFTRRTFMNTDILRIETNDEQPLLIEYSIFDTEK